LFRAALCIGFMSVFGCSRGIELGSDLGRVDVKAGGGANVGAAGTPGTAAPDASSSVCEVTRCDNKIYACGDCVDNDADSLVDQLDPECFGPCDDSEESYLSSTVGQSDATCKVDCYFDGDNGSGNDDCHWSHRCDPLSMSPDFPPSGNAQCAYAPLTAIPGSSQNCEQLAVVQSDTCLSTCLPLTPPGCDCFGCCEWPIGSGRAIWLGSTLNGAGSCDATLLDDKTRCHPCTRVSACSK